MKITICGSMAFADKLIEIYNQLKELSGQSGGAFFALSSALRLGWPITKGDDYDYRRKNEKDGRPIGSRKMV